MRVGVGDRVSLLPPAPPAVPADLTRATSRYKRHAWLAVLGLLTFVAVYFALTGWFCWTSYRLFADMFSGGRDGFFDFVGGALSGLLGVFLLSALFFVKPSGASEDLEVTAEQEPELFRFLNALADRARAPRPHRVFLSMRVNAAVFYELTLVNLLIPSKKNLEIGLGLVNTLNLSEMTAVLAHEFGHFAQRSMAVGRWVYIAQQVAGQIIASRGWLDKLLSGLSSIDFRVAWIGWIMRIIVWSIRSLLDTAFGLVILAQRALGREMESQADLVSVSLTGSDALVHALHRLGAADSAWSNAISVAASELGKGNEVPDLFALQTRVIERMAKILNEPGHGASPERPRSDRQQFRVFEQELAEPPRMWSTHPGNRDREDNAKRVYVEAELDPRPAWVLFSNADKLKRDATAKIVAENADEKQKRQLISAEEALSAVDRRFDRPYFEERYRGAYLGRSIVLHEKTVAALYGDPIPPQSLVEQLTALYPEQLAHDIRDLRQRQEEHANLQALKDGVLDAPGGVIRHRGQVIQKRHLPSLVDQVKGETEAVRKRVEAHDRLCRSIHRAVASQLGQGWDKYLHALCKLHHYSGHAEANLEDARGHLANVFAVVTADGRVSDAERRRLVIAAAELHSALWEVFEQKDLISLPPHILQRLNELMGVTGTEDECKHWVDALPKNFELPAPAEHNIGDWLQVIDSWTNGALHGLGALERVSLEMLVETERRVQHAYLQKLEIEPAPEAPVVPGKYQTLARGQERERQRKLDWWDRFQTADGFGPSLARFAVAGGILAGVLGFGGGIGQPTLVVFNGLGTPVEIDIAGQKLQLSPGQHQSLDLPKQPLKVTARTAAGHQLESFPAEPQGSARYIYNVAGASPLVEWTAVYGNAREVPRRELGAPVWFTSDAEVLFEEPPKSVSTKGGGATRRVLSGGAQEPAARSLSLVSNEVERAHVIKVHTEWDLPSDRFVQGYIVEAMDLPDAAAVMAKRLAHYPGDIAALRAEQDLAKGPEKQAVCARHAAAADAAPQNLDLRYLALRCPDHDPSADQKLLEGHRQHPQHPFFANAAGRELQRQRDYEGALKAYRVAASSPILTEQASLQAARLVRVLGKPDTASDFVALNKELDSTAIEGSHLQMMLALEAGASDGEPIKSAYRAYSLLGRGELSEALEAASDDPKLHAQIARLVGASDGASPDEVQQALTLAPERGVTGTTVLPSIALADREGKEHAALDAKAIELLGKEHAPLEFAGAKVYEGKPAEVEAKIYQLAADAQVQACLMALVRVGEKAPPSCRTLVRAFLFAPERPFFR